MKVQSCCATDPLIKIKLDDELRRQLLDIPNDESLEKDRKIFVFV